MTAKEMREALATMDDDAEVTIDVENIPGIDTLSGAWAVSVAEGDGYVVIAAVAP